MRIYDHPELTEAEVIALYDSVGWSQYTAKPAKLMRAIAGSHLVLTARNDAGRLVGLARTVSDGATVCYVQDLLVEPAAQRHGIGRALLNGVLRRYAACPFVLLSTEHEDSPGGAVSHPFYRSLGFVEHSEQKMATFGLPLTRDLPD